MYIPQGYPGEVSASLSGGAVHRNLQLMYQDPLVEIGGHGNVHICDLQDALVGEEKLRSWLGLGEGDKTGQEVNWTWSMEKFLALCAYLQKLEREGKIELCWMRKLGEEVKG